MYIYILVSTGKAIFLVLKNILKILQAGVMAQI